MISENLGGYQNGRFRLRALRRQAQGGAPTWFRCPCIVNGRPCYRRVGKLFSAGRYFLCRHCQNVAYASQSETLLDLAHWKRDKVRAAVGAEPGCYGRIPPRRKGQWHRTYLRQWEAVHAVDSVAGQAFGEAAAKLLARIRWR